jgi:hypothetical protein
MLVCECATVHPDPRKIGPSARRPIPIHNLIQPAGYPALLTQPSSQGDPHKRTDDLIKDWWIIEVQDAKP